SGYKSTKRIMVIIITRLLLFLQILRFGSSALFKRRYVSLVLMDLALVLGDPFMKACSFTTIVVTAFAIGVTIFYQESTNTYYIMKIFYLLKHNLVKYPLSKVNYRKISIRVNLVTDNLLKPIFCSLVIFTSI